MFRLTRVLDPYLLFVIIDSKFVKEQSNLTIFTRSNVTKEGGRATKRKWVRRTIVTCVTCRRAGTSL